jgi:hypothetical protein
MDDVNNDGEDVWDQKELRAMMNESTTSRR